MKQYGSKSSIVPPPSGGGYVNRAARLASPLSLQLCRPLPGAVTAVAAAGWGEGLASSIVPPPSGGGYRQGQSQGRGGRRQVFNCAAPFRGRLLRQGRPIVAQQYPSSIVPPPSGGGYVSVGGQTVTCYQLLQLCRPLPGAVTIHHQQVAPVDAYSSIVPPPSGGGYGRRHCWRRSAAPCSSIVPPPSGGGYTDPDLAALAKLTVLQLCRPLPGAVTPEIPGRMGRHPAVFNCAAPFRGRLPGGNYDHARLAISLQLCRPLPGAVTRHHRDRRPARRQVFNCAAPFRGRLPARPTARWPPPPLFNCAAPFRGRLRRPAAIAAAPAAPLFNCAAPFRGRLPGRYGSPPPQRRIFNCAAPFRGRLRGPGWAG